MSTTAELFSRWKAAKGYSSEREALRALRLSPGAAVHWKAGRNADADIIERMAADLGENAGALIAQAMAEQAKGDAAKTWTRLAKQLGAAAVVVLAVALPYPAAATVAPKLNDDGFVHYAQWLRRLRTWLASMARRPRFAHASPVLA